MAVFREKTGTKSAVLYPKNPFPDIGAFSVFVRDIIVKNPFGCTSYMTGRKNHPPVEKIREMYTAKFVYLDKNRVQVGSGSEIYHTLDGYEDGIAAVVSNTANALAHGGKAKHIPDADLFSVTLQCHDPDGTLWFMSIARDRVAISAYKDDAVKKRVGEWAKTVPGTAVSGQLHLSFFRKPPLRHPPQMIGCPSSRVSGPGRIGGVYPALVFWPAYGRDLPLPRLRSLFGRHGILDSFYRYFTFENLLFL